MRSGRENSRSAGRHTARSLHPRRTPNCAFRPAVNACHITVAEPGAYRTFAYRQLFGSKRDRHVDMLKSRVQFDVVNAPHSEGRTAVAKAVHADKCIFDVLSVRHVGVRSVCAGHNLVGQEQYYRRTEPWCRRWLARLAEATIVDSYRAGELVAETHDASAMMISDIPHGDSRDVDVPLISSNYAHLQLGLPQEGCVFLFFGMTRPYKGVLKLLAAEAAPNVRLRLERVPDDKVATYFSAADVVVLPFDRALTSGSLELARSFEKPVLHPDLEALAGGGGTTLTHPASGGTGELRRALLTSLTDFPGGNRQPLTSWRSVSMSHASLFAATASRVRL